MGAQPSIVALFIYIIHVEFKNTIREAHSQCYFSLKDVDFIFAVGC